MQDKEHQIPVVQDLASELANADPLLKRDILLRLVAGASSCLPGSPVDLRGGTLRKTNLEGVCLDRAILADADLAGACLQGAKLSQADLRGAMLEDANLEGAFLRFADLRGATLESANLTRADLWGANLEGAVLRDANLECAVLTETHLQRADLSGTNLRGAILEKADLSRARLDEAEMGEARMKGANLMGAVLAGTAVQGVDLSTCDLTHICLADARLDRTRCSWEQFGGAIGEELNKDFFFAGKGYLSLERNFSGLGDKEAASWAYRKRRRMEKRAALASARTAAEKRKGLRALVYFAHFSSDQFVEWLCDYGESVPRLLGAMVFVYLSFMVLYSLTDSVVRVHATPTGVVTMPTHGIADLAVFSLLAMTTSGTPSVGLQPRSEIVYLLTGLQALLGIALTGLLGFVLGNRIRR